MAATVKRVSSQNLVPICILRILEDYSDSNHKLTQSAINKYLYDDYGIEHIEKRKDAKTKKLIPTGRILPGIERKAVGHIIKRLSNELGIAIESDCRGVWLKSRLFQDNELHMLVDSIFSCRYIPKNYSEDLIKKISCLSNIYFNSHIKYTYSADNLSKTENQSIFSNIERVDEAIESKRQVEFDYTKLDANKKPYITAHHVVSCYRMIVHNGRYYLMGLNEKHKDHITYYRLDRVQNMKIINGAVLTPIRKVQGYNGGLLNSSLPSNLPYLFTDKQERIIFYALPSVINDMFDWFGLDVNIDIISKSKDDRYKLSVTSSPMAFKFIAQQYLDEIEVIHPKWLREEIYKVVTNAAKKYK